MALALAFGIPSLVAIGHYKGTPWWAVGGLIVAAIFFLAAVFFFAAPLLARRASRTAAPSPSGDDLPAPPLRMSVTPVVDGERLRLALRNAGPRGMFTAGVTGITDPDGKPVPGRPQSWPIPWLEDGSIAPADLPQFEGRTLDFARFNAGESDPWPHLAYWLFSSLPKPVGVTYDPVRSLDELAAQRFLVTVRITQAEPLPNYMEQQFSIGVSGDGHLVCERAPDGSGPQDPEHDRAPLEITLEDENWLPVRRIGYVFALLIKIGNTTGQPIGLAGCGLGVQWLPDRDAAPVALSDEDDRALGEEARIREQGGRYEPLLRDQKIVQPDGSVSGWLVGYTGRPWTGGRPQCTIRVTDALGNTYTKIIEQRDPKHYGRPES